PPIRRTGPLDLPACRGGRRRSRRVGRSGSRQFAERICFTSPLAGEVGGEAAGWGGPAPPIRRTGPLHLPACRGGRRRSRRVGRSGSANSPDGSISIYEEVPPKAAERLLPAPPHSWGGGP